MEKFLWPWESEVIIEYPWALYVFVFFLSILFSMITWVRMKKKQKKKSNRSK